VQQEECGGLACSRKQSRSQEPTPDQVVPGTVNLIAIIYGRRMLFSSFNKVWYVAFILPGIICNNARIAYLIATILLIRPSAYCNVAMPRVRAHNHRSKRLVIVIIIIIGV
jgi:hypothetical protein